MAIGMANDYATKIEGLLYCVRNIDYIVHCASIFQAVHTRKYIKRFTFPQTCTLRLSSQTGQFWSNIGKFLIINIFPNSMLQYFHILTFLKSGCIFKLKRKNKYEVFKLLYVGFFRVILAKVLKCFLLKVSFFLGQPKNHLLHGQNDTTIT